MNLKQLVCPLSEEKVNEQVTRTNALLSVILVVSGFVFHSAIFFVVLTADFYIRAFTTLKFSPVGFISHSAVNALRLNKKSIDKAPKVFAARIGFVLSLAISVLFLLNMNTAALITGGVLVFFATLEFALAICMGCILYTYLILPFNK